MTYYKTPTNQDLQNACYTSVTNTERKKKYMQEIVENLKVKKKLQVQFMIIYEDFFFRLHLRRFFFRLHLRILESRNTINESNKKKNCCHSLLDIQICHQNRCNRCLPSRSIALRVRSGSIIILQSAPNQDTSTPSQFCQSVEIEHMKATT